MKNFIYSILMLSIFSSFLFAQGAEEEKKLSFSVNSGISVPCEPKAFSDGWKPGFNLGAGVGVRVSNNVVLQGVANYNYFPLDKDEFPSTATVEGGSVKAINFSGNVRIDTGEPQPSKFTPYFIGGAGLTIFSASDLKVDMITYSKDSENAFAINVGAGCDIGLSEKASLFIEVGYAIAFTDSFYGDKKTNYLPIKIGVSFR